MGMLAVLGGNCAPSETTLRSILESVGVGFDSEKASVVVKKLKGKDINELIALGAGKMSSMPTGGAVAAGGGGGAAAAEPEPEEAKKTESEESGSDDDMGFG